MTSHETSCHVLCALLNDSKDSLGASLMTVILLKLKPYIFHFFPSSQGCSIYNSYSGLTWAKQKEKP